MKKVSSKHPAGKTFESPSEYEYRHEAMHFQLPLNLMHLNLHPGDVLLDGFRQIVEFDFHLKELSMSVLLTLCLSVRSEHPTESVVEVSREFSTEAKPSADPWIWERPRTVELGGPLVARERKNEQAAKGVRVSNVIDPNHGCGGRFADDRQVGLR
jgi:hypothetical protein